MKFKVGDRIIYRAGDSGYFAKEGKRGTVIEAEDLSTYPYLITFDFSSKAWPVKEDELEAIDA